jgi:opacity protein-like surface antigen
MNRILLSSLLLAGSASALSASSTPGWYVTGSAGVVFSDGKPFYDEFPAGREAENAGSTRYLKDGFTGALGVGYDWVGFRLEGEFLHFSNDYSTFIVPRGKSIDYANPAAGYYDVTLTGTLEGKTSNNGFFANGYYDFNVGLPIKPYIGLGVGLVGVTSNYKVKIVNILYDSPAVADLTGFATPDPGTVDATKWLGAAQVKLGFWYPLDSHWDVGACYRYTIIDGARWDFVQKVADVTIITITQTTKDQHVEVALKYNF